MRKCALPEDEIICHGRWKDRIACDATRAQGCSEAEKSVEGNGTQGSLRALSSLGNRYEVSVLYLLGYTEGPTMAPRIIVATIHVLLFVFPPNPNCGSKTKKSIRSGAIYNTCLFGHPPLFTSYPLPYCAVSTEATSDNNKLSPTLRRSFTIRTVVLDSIGVMTRLYSVDETFLLLRLF